MTRHYFTRHAITLLLCLLIALPAMSQPRGRTIIVTRGTPPRGGIYYDNGSSWRYNNNYFGLRLGMNMSQVRSEAQALNGTGLRTGLNVGAVAGFQLSPVTPVFFETGIYYTQKGGKSDNVATLENPKTKFTYDLNYLELPLLIKYQHFVNPEVSIQPYAGGYLACGVSGDIKDYGNRKAFSAFDDKAFRRFDGGLKLGCGLGFNACYVDLSYDIGLANIGQDAFDSTHNGCFTVNVGVNF